MNRFFLGLTRIQKAVQSVRSEIASRQEANAPNTANTGGLVDHKIDKDDTCCSANTGGESLEDLLNTLHRQMKNSDWLKENTAEKWAAENPELAKAFLPKNTEK